MRPGEILPADGPVPAARPSRTAGISVRNTGRFPAYLTSHFPLEDASGALQFDRDAARGGRPHLPAGASVRIGPQETVEVQVAWR